MKTILKTLLLIPFVTFLFSCNKYEMRETKHDNGKPYEQFSVLETEDGSFIKDKDYKTWYPNGNVEIEGFYKMGKKSGNWKYWYSNGQMQSEYNFVRDSLEGAFAKWYDNGQKLIEGTKKMDLDINNWTGWFENGQMEFKENYDKKGNSEGLQTAWHANGQKASEMNFIDGKNEGAFNFWSNKGEPYIAVTLKNGVDINLPIVYKNNLGEKLEMMPDGTYKFAYFEEERSLFFNYGRMEGEWKSIDGNFELVNNKLKLKGFNEYKIKKYNSDTLVIVRNFANIEFVKVP